MRRPVFAIPLMLSMLAIGCDEAPPSPAVDPGDCSAGKCDDPDANTDASTSTCVAVRGNGPLITAHFGALARVAEERGPVAGIAGGSSGSITSFITESIVHNPLLYDCRPDADTPEDIACTPAQTRARTALLYKSFLGYLDALSQSNEALAFETLLRFRQRVTDQGADETLDEAGEAPVETEDEVEPQVRDALGAVRDILGSSDIRELVGVGGRCAGLPAGLQSACAETADLVFDLRIWRAVWFARDIVGATADAAQFKPADHHMFIRPGVVDFTAVARKLGRVSSFYVGPLRHENGDGYGTYDTLERVDLTRGSAGGDAGLPESSLPGPILTFDDGYRWFLDGCAEQSVGMTWSQLQDIVVDTNDHRTPDGTAPSCGELFTELVGTYRQEFREEETFVNSRIDDAIGAPGGRGGDMVVITTTGVLESQHAIDQWNAARKRYTSNRELTETSDWQLDFAQDVGLGYWSSDDVLDTLENGLRTRSDLKSEMFTPLGAASWMEILSASPAEPGLARGVELGNGLISVGGWSDPHPTVVLRETGECDEIVYVTKRGEEGSFARGVQSQLGGEELLDAFYDLDDPQSAVSTALDEADRILCADWDDIPFSNPAAVFEDAFDADVIQDGTPIIRGCTPGA